MSTVTSVGENGTANLHVDRDLPGDGLRVLKCLLDRVDRSEGHAKKRTSTCIDRCEVENVYGPLACELFEPIVPLVLHQHIGDDLDDLCTVRDTRCVRRVPRVLDKFWAVQNLGS